MLLAYVDESFSQSWYFMAALLCSGEEAQHLSATLDAVVAKAARDHGVPGEAELHGYELFNGTKWWEGVPPRVRIGVYNDAFAAIATHCTGLILRGMDVDAQRRRYIHPEPAHTVVLQHLLERLNEECRRRGELLLIIADEVGEQATKHRSDLRHYRQHGTDGYRRQKITQIIDTLHFAPSHESRLVQAIDLVVFMHRRISIHTETDDRASRANRRLWDRVTPKIAHVHIWLP